jgi:hypothetical protein
VIHRFSSRWRGGVLKKITSSCERAGFDGRFVEPLRVHSNIYSNIGAGHGNLTKEIFKHITDLDRARIATDVLRTGGRDG